MLSNVYTNSRREAVRKAAAEAQATRARQDDYTAGRIRVKLLTKVAEVGPLRKER